ncbi:MAG: DNA adenine methylase [Luteolibacter sp.]
MPHPAGKRRLLKYLLPLVPPHTCYVEVFGGGGALLFAKKPSSVEVYNDLNGELVNLMRQAKWHGEELRREINLVPNSRELFRAYLANPGMTEIQRAARFLLINRWSFGGQMNSYGVAKTSGGGGGNIRLSRVMRNVEAVTMRLDGVNIENLDWSQLVPRYDAPGTFFFFDPPYVRCSDTTYRAWTPEQMQRFRETLDSLKGNWLATVDDSPECREIFTGFKITEVSRANGIERRPGRSKNPIFRELILRPQN